MVQALEKDSTDLFSEIVKNVDLTSTQVGELLSNHESSLGSQVEGQIHRLEQEVAQLHWRSEELNRLADIQDNVCFLKVTSDGRGLFARSFLHLQDELILTMKL